MDSTEFTPYQLEGTFEEHKMNRLAILVDKDHNQVREDRNLTLSQGRRKAH